MWLHPYLLEPKDSLNSKTSHKPRLGFFVKDFDFSKNAIVDLIESFLKYSDFIHWTELGDPELKDLKPFLMKLVSNDINYPFKIAENDLIPVKSNALISTITKNLGQELEQLQDQRFEVLKFKMGRSFKEEFASLMKVNLKNYLVRVDLNNIMNFKDAKEALAMLKKIPNLEYVEDPMPYGDYHWSELRKITPLALDHYTEPSIPSQFEFRIIKPIRGFSLPELQQWTYEKKKIVLTNMMDNVVGTWKTYFYYCELKKHFPYHLCTPGFHTHTLYHDFEYASMLLFDGALWTFDKKKLEALVQMLNSLNWIELNYLDDRNLDHVLKDAKDKYEREK